MRPDFEAGRWPPEERLSKSKYARTYPYSTVGAIIYSQAWPHGRLSDVPTTSLTQSDVDALYRRHVTLLRHSTRRILRDQQLAEDVVQETFVRFMKYAADNDVQHAGALLYKIATRLAVKRLRKSYNHLEIKEYVEPASSSGSGQGPDDRIAIIKVLSLSNEEEAQIALMYYVDGLQQDEIATILDIPRRTISHRIQSFCERAARLLQRNTSSPGDPKAYQIETAKALAVEGE